MGDDEGTGSNTQAVAYQIDPAHDGAQLADTLRVPLKRRWAHDFTSGAVSYPVAAAGRVFVTVGGDQSPETSLYALDASTGKTAWGPIKLTDSNMWATLAYESGRVFAVSSTGMLQAFDESSGKVLFGTQLPYQHTFSSPPTAAGGRVFVGGSGTGGTVYGVDGSTGAVLWTATVANGDESSPVVTASGVYVGYACNQVYDLAPASGQVLWRHEGSCEGGGGRTLALLGSALHTRDAFDGNLILDSLTGTKVGDFSSSLIPAGRGSTRFTVEAGKLVATPVAGGAALWTFSDGYVTSAPLVVGDKVVIGDNTGKLSVLFAESGQLADRATLDAPIMASDEQFLSGPFMGMASADNRLLVAAGSVLYAY